MTVEIFSNGKQAFDRLQEGAAFDLILMDLGMPVMDGYEATVAIQKSGCNTPIIALTADTFATTRDRCLEVGMQALAEKPCRPLDLFSTMVDCLA